MHLRRLVLHYFALVAMCSPGAAAGGVPEGQPKIVRLKESVANIEFENQEFTPSRPTIARSEPSSSTGKLYFGRIGRRLPSDPRGFSRRDVPFAAAYVRGTPVAFWCDINLDGELSDEHSLPLYHYPTPAGARADLVDLTWKVKVGTDSIPISWKIRVILDPVAAGDSLPRYRLQQVFARTGTITIDGRTRSLFLYDGNHDGLYSMEYGDGAFIDADGDGEVIVDATSPEFLPFRVPTQVGGTLFETLRVDARGSEIELSAISGQREQRQASVGDPAPDFTFDSLDGKHVHLSDYKGHPVVVYFWASWCSACVALAPALRAVYERLHPRGLEILSVSFDRDRAKLVEFEAKQREPWPISYVGREFWENPIGRLYGVSAAGAAYLLDANGKYLGLYYDFEDLEEKAATLLPQ